MSGGDEDDVMTGDNAASTASRSVEPGIASQRDLAVERSRLRPYDQAVRITDMHHGDAGADTHGDDYMEGNDGNDEMYGQLGDDFAIGKRGRRLRWSATSGR